jgi:succinyl-CoA synthetase beta subunit
MARVLEDDAKRLLSAHGVRVPVGARVTTHDEARKVAAGFGGHVVVKALVPIGRRGKAQLVRACSTADQAADVARQMLGRQFDGYPIDAVLVEEQIDIAAEHYLSIVIDAHAKEYAVLLGGRGGVDVELHTTSIRRVGVRPGNELSPAVARRAWEQAGVVRDSEALVDVTRAATRAFRDLDATLLEINPLARDTTGRVFAVGVMLSVDDAALRRQPEVAHVSLEGSDRAWRPETALEARVAAINAVASERGSARYLELEGGDIGFLCGGGGASLLLFDALVAAGGAPANYAEFGGNPTEGRVYDLTRVVLDKPGVRGLFVAHNITNNTQVDVVARGVTCALADAAPPQPFPVVAREVGVNDEEGRRIFEAAGVEYLGVEQTLNQAAQRMAARMNEARAAWRC